MAFTLRHLDYGLDALEPMISRRTMEFHYGKHYAGYVAKTNDLVGDTEFASMPLLEIVKRTTGDADQSHQALFNNAAQAWNHEFFWECLAPNGGGTPPDPVRKRLEHAFGSVEAFKKAFVEAGKKQFGSGWVWLVSKDDGLHIVTTGNAQVPSFASCEPLLVCDVWEHAYYLDYQNERDVFLQSFLDKLVNWQFVGRRMEECKVGFAA